jgi:hypothetical protein
MDKCQLPGCGKIIHWKARDREYCCADHREKAISEDIGERLNAATIPYDRQLTGDPKRDMMADLIDFGRCASLTTPEGIERIDPLSVVEEIARHNAENPDCPLEFISEPLPMPSPWQGDTPEGTLAHKLKYGEWYKDGHEPR